MKHHMNRKQILGHPYTMFEKQWLTEVVGGQSPLHTGDEATICLHGAILRNIGGVFPTVYNIRKTAFWIIWFAVLRCKIWCQLVGGLKKIREAFWRIRKCFTLRGWKRSPSLSLQEKGKKKKEPGKYKYGKCG